MLPRPIELAVDLDLQRVSSQAGCRPSSRDKHATLTSFGAVRRVMRRKGSGSGTAPFASASSGPSSMEAGPGPLVPLRVRLRLRRARLPLAAGAPAGNPTVHGIRSRFMSGSWRKGP